MRHTLSLSTHASKAALCLPRHSFVHSNNLGSTIPAYYMDVNSLLKVFKLLLTVFLYAWAQNLSFYSFFCGGSFNLWHFCQVGWDLPIIGIFINLILQEKSWSTCIFLLTRKWKIGHKTRLSRLNKNFNPIPPKYSILNLQVKLIKGQNLKNGCAQRPPPLKSYPLEKKNVVYEDSDGVW